MIINQKIKTMKIKKNFTTGVLAGICGILVLFVIMGSTTPEISNNYQLVPINKDGSVNIKLNLTQLNELSSSLTIDEDHIIDRILFCIDGSTVGDCGKLSTYCNN